MKRGRVKIVVDLLHDRVVKGYSKKFTVWKDHQTANSGLVHTVGYGELWLTTNTLASTSG